MGYYLFDHPQAVQQYHPTRNSRWSGGVLIHTAENVMDSVGPDTGAENVASYITRRTDYGSYHILADSDSVIEMLPPTATAFHCAASGYNSTTVGVSYACRTVDLNPESAWFRSATDLITKVLVRWWRENGFDPRAAKFIPAADTKVRLGLSTHGEAQPVDRSDAWTRRPDRNRLEAVFADAILKNSGRNPNPYPEDDEVKQVMVTDPRDGKVWNICGNTRYYIASPREMQALRFLGVPLVDNGSAGLVDWITSCKDLGRKRGE